ncbi:hypothetical protein J437_LFUL015995, partial [Ladona fulva]
MVSKFATGFGGSIQCCKMANFGTQAAIRSKWTDLVESSTFEVPDEVSSGVRSVVGWLKQVKIFHMVTMHAHLLV